MITITLIVGLALQLLIADSRESNDKPEGEWDEAFIERSDDIGEWMP